MPMEEVGLMGGTFNPIHIRELMVAQCAAEQFGLKKVIWVPNGIPPHKKVDVLDKELRFEMVAAAVKDNPLFEASRVEVDRPGVSWTIDTLKHYKELLGSNVRLNFIIGEDVLGQLLRYERREELFKLCRLLVSPREVAKPDLLTPWREKLPGAEMELIDCPSDSCSSTLIRKWIRSGKSVRYLVAPAVYEILVEKKHYQQPLPVEPAESVPAAVPPVAVPSQPVAVPSQPAAVPSQPAVVPSPPAAVPSPPVAVPSQPVAVPSQPAVVPSQPAVVPSPPAAVPSQPTAVPSQPTAVPSQPVAVPSQPTPVPSQPTAVGAASQQSGSTLRRSCNRLRDSDI